MTTCTICKKEVNWEEVVETMGHIWSHADQFGMESLTEQEQVLASGRICSEECYEKLD